ncbi:hypothetical protein LAG90_15575 [Marinilongibacter aquaticus]|uniref:hypothetical protein n=1 Tax=Marinilongibacter aquaticus TaxID=2975157 RepID=UPI0021BD7B84|nr:hypothetical protein [Marinilongibacter aquaticus]UBM58223.1 hypothetical protein LAG90_15575 [Marinilongibacter aquaticus]
MPLVWQLKYMGDEYEHAIAIARQILRLFGHKQLSDRNVIEGLREIAWMLTTTLSERPFKSVRIKGKSYYLPKENFLDTTSIELAFANIHYLQFTANAKQGAGNTQESQRALFKLLAIVCRPSSTKVWLWKKADREEFDNEKCERRSSLFSKLPFGTVLTILAYWEEQNRLFFEMYQEVFENEDGKSLFENGEGWIATLEDVAKDGVHGNFDAVAGKNAHTIWTYLSHQKTIFESQKSTQK